MPALKFANDWTMILPDAARCWRLTEQGNKKTGPISKN